MDSLASSSSWGREFVAGGLGGMAGVLAGYPLDTVRIRQQYCKSREGSSALAVFKRIVAREGPWSLFRGMAAPLASVAFHNAIVFQSYATLSRAFDRNNNAPNDPPSYASVAMGGIGSGAIQSLIISPIELLKIRLQLKPKPNNPNGPLHLAQNIFRNEGFRGMYRGLGITLLRDVPSHGVYFWTYEYAREILHPGCRKTGRDTFGTMLVAGGLAGVTSWISCYPMDVIKTKIQAQKGGDEVVRRDFGIVDCFRRCVREEGCSVLWRGLGTAVGRAFVVNGAVFVAYETALRFV